MGSSQQYNNPQNMMGSNILDQIEQLNMYQHHGISQEQAAQLAAH
jgi:hypothetical protein